MKYLKGYFNFRNIQMPALQLNYIFVLHFIIVLDVLDF